MTKIKSIKDNTHIVASDFILPLLCAVIYCSWAMVLPIDLSPDEPMRLSVPFYIYEHGVLPFGNEKEILSDIWGSSYALFPYGSSLISVVCIKIASLFTNSKYVFVWAARLGSIIPATGTIFVCQQIGKRLYDNHAACYLLACICGLLPQAVFLASYLNNESLMVFSIAMIVHAWLIGIDSDWDLRSKVYLGASLGICSLSYYFGYGYILASIIVYYASACKKAKEKHAEMTRVYKGAVLIFAVAFVIGGWFFVRNVAIHGDLFGFNASHQIAEQNAIEGFTPSDHLSPDDEGLSPLDMIFSEYRGLIWWKTSLLSSIGLFGYMNIFLPTFIYIAYGLFFLFGLLLCVPRVMRFDRKNHLIHVVFALLIVFSISMSVYYSWASDYQPQGRYLASALIPFSIFVTHGYDWLSVRKPNRDMSYAGQTIINGIPAIPTAVLIYCALFFCVAVLVIIPYCTQGIFFGAGYHGLLQPTPMLAS